MRREIRAGLAAAALAGLLGAGCRESANEGEAVDRQLTQPQAPDAEGEATGTGGSGEQGESDEAWGHGIDSAEHEESRGSATGNAPEPAER